MRVVAVGLSVVFIASLAWAQDQAQEKTVTIAGETYTVVSDEQFRALGFDVPDVKPEENAAYDYIEAINGYVAPNAEQEDLRDRVSQGTWTEEAGPLADYIERNEDTLERIRAAATKDVCHFPVVVPLGSSIEEASPAGILLPHLASMREFARFLVAEGKAYEFEGRYKEALDTYLLALRLGSHVAQDPILINGLVGIACSQIGTRAIEQCLVRNEVDDDVLLNAQKRLAKLAEGRPSVIVAMGGERAWSTSIIEYMIEHPGDGFELIDPDDAQSKATDVAREAWQGALVAMLGSEEGQAQIRADMKTFWAAVDSAMAMPLRVFIETGAGDEPVEKAKARKAPPNIVVILGAAFSRARVQYAGNDVSWTVLDVEFALARYAAEHDQYPASLDEVKDFMLSDGVDPFSSERLKYRLEDDGAFTIWSVGQNLTDDGGRIPERHHLNCDDDDYVWNSAVIHGEE